MKLTSYTIAALTIASVITGCSPTPGLDDKKGGGNNGTVAVDDCEDIAGTWDVRVELDGSACGWGEPDTSSETATIEQDGCDIIYSGEVTFDGTVDGSNFTLGGRVEEDGGIEYDISGEVGDEELTGSGTFEVTDDDGQSCTGTIDITGYRTGDLPNGNNGNDGNNGTNGANNGVEQLTTEQLAVGGWAMAGTCGENELEFGWFLCPGGGLRGYEKINGYEFLDCGSWSVEGDTVVADVTSTAVADSSVVDTLTWNLTYSETDDTLTNQGACAFVMGRLSGEAITEEDCTTGFCSSGSDPEYAECGTDCDCGRCWYCESSTDMCRYGGEGPFGCYRGCGE